MDVHKKVWGEEHWIANTPLYCGKKLLLKKAFRCSIHYHKLKHETFYVQSGLILMEVGDNCFLMKPGDSVEIKQGIYHRFTGCADQNEIFEFSTQHFEDDSYRLIESGPVSSEDMEFLLDKYGV